MKKLLRFVLIPALVLLASFLVVPVAGLADPGRAGNLGSPVGHSFVISDQPLEELDPAIAYNINQQEYLVVFWNDRPGNDDIRAERVSADGKKLEGFWVATGMGNDRRYPDVAYNVQTNQYLVVWEDYVQSAGAYAIHGRLISATGQLISEEIIRSVSPDKPAHPAVAYASTSHKFLVVWDEQLGTPPNQLVHIVGQMVNSEGSMSGANFIISQDPGAEPRGQPDLAYNRTGNGYLVAWSQQYSGGICCSIHARIVAAGGALAGLDIPISSGLTPHVAAIPTATSFGEYLVAWKETGLIDSYFYAKLVAGNGNLDGTAHLVTMFPVMSYFIFDVAGNENSRQYLFVVKEESSPLIAQSISSDFAMWSGWQELDSGPGADHPVAASGPLADFLVAFDRSPSTTRDIYGQLWSGPRFFLPLVIRN